MLEDKQFAHHFRLQLLHGDSLTHPIRTSLIHPRALPLATESIRRGRGRGRSNSSRSGSRDTCGRRRRMDLSQDAAAAAGHLTSTYRWIPIVGGFVAVAWAVAVGAVDFPLSFAPAVGSGALTLPQAVLLASLLEISGAYLLGIREWDTLVARVMRHRPPGQDDALLMWGLFICLIVAAAWLAAAVHWELPVSSTLAVWGAMIGILVSVSGVKSVYWTENKGEMQSALGVGGVLSIVLSWILAPCIAAAIAFLIFGATKHLVLRTQHCVERSLRAMPIYYGVTVAVLIYFVIYRACPRVHLRDLDPRRASLIAGLSGCLASLLAYLIVVPMAQRRLGCFNSASASPSSGRGLAMPSADGEESTRNPNSHLEQQQEEQDQEPGQDGGKKEQELSPDELIQQFTERKMLATVVEGDEEEQSSDFSLHYKSRSISSPAVPPPAVLDKPKLSFGQLLASTPNRLLSFQKLRRRPPLTGREKFMRSLLRLRTATYSRRLTYDRHTLVRHALAEKFDAKAEELFSFLQILTASAAALAHGSNELAWAMGPYAAVVGIYSHGTADGAGKGSLVPWLLLLGGAGASVGFAIWGWKIIRSVGGRLVYLSPARGFSAHISALATVVLALKVRLPLSTTHILIGALVGVGLADSRKHVNWPLLAVFVTSWATMLLLTCGTAAAFYSFTVYSPSYRGKG